MFIEPKSLKMHCISDQQYANRLQFLYGTWFLYIAKCLAKQKELTPSAVLGDENAIESIEAIEEQITFIAKQMKDIKNALNEVLGEN